MTNIRLINTVPSLTVFIRVEKKIFERKEKKMEPIKVKTMDELVEERKRERESSLDEMHFWFIVCTVLFSFAILWVGYDRYARFAIKPTYQHFTGSVRGVQLRWRWILCI